MGGRGWGDVTGAGKAAPEIFTCHSREDVMNGMESDGETREGERKRMERRKEE